MNNDVTNAKQNVSGEKKTRRIPKKRKTIADRLEELDQQLERISKERRKVKAREKEVNRKDYDRLQMTLGIACLNFFTSEGNIEEKKFLGKILKSSARAKDKEWLSENSARLLKMYENPDSDKGGANG